MSTVKIHRNFFKQQSISQTHFRRKSQIKIKMKLWRQTEGREPRNFCGLPFGLQRTVWKTLIGHRYCTWVGHWKFIWGWSFDHKGHLLHTKGADLQLRPPRPLNSLLRGSESDLESERKRCHSIFWATLTVKGRGLALPLFQSPS